jgi:hypothetical protein
MKDDSFIFRNIGLDCIFSRKEIIRMAMRLIPDCIQAFFAHTYICITFLVIYGTMWSLNMPFDTSFFAVVACLLNFLEFSVMDFGNSIRHLVNYLAAAKRIEVTLVVIDECEQY